MYILITHMTTHPNKTSNQSALISTLLDYGKTIVRDENKQDQGENQKTAYKIYLPVFCVECNSLLSLSVD